MGSLFPVDTWNHFSNPDDRTNNRVESYNLKMRKFVGAAQPEINKAVNAPIGFEMTATNTYLRAKLKDARANPSRREWHDREVILKGSSAGKFKHGLSDYIEEIVGLSLVDLPEKKKVMLDDTDEENCFDSSDAESDRDLSDLVERQNERRSRTER